MTVTYMFRARNRETGAIPAPQEPLLLTNPVTVPTPDAPPTAAPDWPEAEGQAGTFAESQTAFQAAIQTPAPAAETRPVGLPIRYVGTKGRILLVAKARGGIGATTLAVNLALELQGQKANAAARVALVDLDVQMGNAASLLDLADRGGMLALARLAADPDAQAVRHAMVRHGTGLNVLVAPATAVPFDAFDQSRIAALLDALAAEHDVVVVDLPPALIGWLEPLLARAERLLMVTDLAVPSLVRAHRLITLMTEDHPDLPVEIVVAHERKPFRMGRTHRDAEAALGHPLRHWLPQETRLARQAQDRGEPLVQLAPRCGWSRAVRAMAMEMQPLPRGMTRLDAERAQ
jgi:Flp pilus assembly CpaE family ATPase